MIYVYMLVDASILDVLVQSAKRSTSLRETFQEPIANSPGLTVSDLVGKRMCETPIKGSMVRGGRLLRSVSPIHLVTDRYTASAWLRPSRLIMWLRAGLELAEADESDGRGNVGRQGKEEDNVVEAVLYGEIG